MFQQIGHFFSLFFGILAGGLFLIGIYFGFVNYKKILLGAETGLKYCTFGIFSLCLSFIISSTLEHGFSWTTLCFFIATAMVMSFLLYVDVLIRKKTASFLSKRNPYLFDTQYSKNTDENTSNSSYEE